ncbi:MAG: RNA polymerase sigma factor, partial [Planctomycetota bacterium]
MATPQPEVLLEHADFVRNVAHHLLRDEHLAEDVVQETFVAALRSSERPRNVRAWLGVIARNLALTGRRSVRRRKLRERRVARRERLPSVEEGVARLELQRRVVGAVADLEEPCRSVVVHRFFYGLGLKDIARRLGVPL